MRKWLVISGILLIAIGMIGGFTAMIAFETSWWTRLIGLVPIGFVLLLTGMVLVLLGPQQEND